MKDCFRCAARVALIAIAIVPSGAIAREVEVTLSPSSGAAQFIEVHRIIKCMHGRDRSRGALACSGWRQVQPGGVINLPVGEYCVYALWADGGSFRGSMMVEPGSTRVQVQFTQGSVILQGPCQ